MLKIIKRLSELDIGSLTKVYFQSSEEAGKRDYPGLPANMQLLYAEQDFYNFLDLYFSQPDPIYAVWEIAGQHKAALRLEEYGDGLLITALETAPEARGKGYAKQLLCDLVRWVKCNKSKDLYAHISKDNFASIAVHEACGFHRIDEPAIYLDGALHPESATYYYPIK